MADPKKLGYLIGELKTMKKSLIGDADDDVKSEEELKSMDKFQKKKRELNQILKTVRTDTDRLTELKRTLGPDTRDANCIKLMNDNSKALKQASELWQELKVIYASDSKKRAKKLGEAELRTRNKQIQNLGQEIVNLTASSTRVKGSAVSNTEELDAQSKRSNRQRQERTEFKNKRKQRRAGKTKGNAIELDDADFDGIGAMSEGEQKFMDQVQANVADQNEMLDEISKGLSELKELSLDMNKTLTTQEHMIAELGNEMDTTIDNFQSANSKLKDILDESGGMTRWCPSLMCLILLLALVGYMLKLF